VTAGKGALFALLVVTGLAVQVSLLNRLPLPGGHADLLLVVVAACALTAGPTAGAITGFVAGILADLVPPADHPVGVLALLLTLVGYGCGLFADVEERSVLVPMVLVALATAGTIVGYAVIGGLAGTGRVSADAFVGALPAGVAYDVVLTPFVVPFVAVLARRLNAPGMPR
jgi:rod shape-determining protein MreD